MALKRRRPALWRAFCAYIVCNRQCTPAPDFERGLLLRPLQLTAAAKKVGLLVTEYMGINRAEAIGQGKHLFVRFCLHAKPLGLLLLLALSGIVHAQGARVHRCIGENGEPSFSDRKCAALKATPAPAPAANAPAQPGSTGAASAAITQTCAVSPQDLRERVAATFAATNTVGFSGLFLWDGFGQGSAIAPLRELAVLIQEPLLAIDLESSLRSSARDRYRYGEARNEDDALYELVIRTVGEEERNVPFESIHHYELTELRGCWWLLMPWQPARQ